MNDNAQRINDNAAREIAQLRGNLSLAEEGLANYHQDALRLHEQIALLQMELIKIKRTREQERDYADVCYELNRLKQRCAALAFLAYPFGAPREAVAGDLGLPEPQSAEQQK